MSIGLVRHTEFLGRISFARTSQSFTHKDLLTSFDELNKQVTKEVEAASKPSFLDNFGTFGSLLKKLSRVSDHLSELTKKTTDELLTSDQKAAIEKETEGDRRGFLSIICGIVALFAALPFVKLSAFIFAIIGSLIPLVIPNSESHSRNS